MAKIVDPSSQTGRGFPFHKFHKGQGALGAHDRSQAARPPFSFADTPRQGDNFGFFVRCAIFKAGHNDPRTTFPYACTTTSLSRPFNLPTSITMLTSKFLLAFGATITLSAKWGVVAQDTTVEYGVDVSFPMHHADVSKNYAWLDHNVDPSVPVPNEYKDQPVQPLGDRQSFYNDFLNGCVDHFGKKGGKRCIQTEADRIEMSLRQPQSMQVCRVEFWMR